MLFLPHLSRKTSTRYFILASIISTILISYIYENFNASVTLSQKWLTGVGKSDITGPIGQINMMGYAVPEQFANGLHLRLKSRAFIFGKINGKRIVYVSIDTATVSFVCKRRAIEVLREKLKTDLYNEKNIMVSAIHTHSGPGGYLDEFLYHITSLGVVELVRESISQGIAESIIRAHYNFELNKTMQKFTQLSVHIGLVNNCSVNRSPSAYLHNPESERSKYPYNVDKEMIILSLKDFYSKKLIATINWFAVHATSMNNLNSYVSGDNKGYASYLWELEEQQHANLDFVAAFSQSNSGDVSPNLSGPFCTDTAKACDGSQTSCNGDITKCVSRGPGFKNVKEQDFASTKIIGGRQFEAAKKILSTQKPSVASLSAYNVVDFRHSWINMSDVEVFVDGKYVKTCRPAMGHSFAAGTTDGPGTSFATQGTNHSSGTSTLLNLVRDLIKQPSPSQVACHAPKQIFISTGEMMYPYTWQPSVVPIQIFLIGKRFVIVGIPGELTTMAGRRIRIAIKNALLLDNIIEKDAVIVVAGLTNSYSSYITTFEEYQVQRYEGGSTIFGPHTLSAYIDQLSRLSHSFRDIKAGPKQYPSPKQEMNPVALLPAIFLDTPPIFMWYGDVKVEPVDSLIGDTAFAVFHCAHPRNQIVGKSFMSVEMYTHTGVWIEILDDSGWDTKFYWERKGTAESLCTVSWSIGESVPVSIGVYRFKYFGRHKILSYEADHSGTSKPFRVNAAKSN